MRTGWAINVMTADEANLFPRMNDTVNIFQYKWTSLSVFQIKVLKDDASALRPVVRWTNVWNNPRGLKLKHAHVLQNIHGLQRSEI